MSAPTPSTLFLERESELEQLHSLLAETGVAGEVATLLATLKESHVSRDDKESVGGPMKDDADPRGGGSRRGRFRGKSPNPRGEAEPWMTGTREMPVASQRLVRTGYEHDRQRCTSK